MGFSSDFNIRESFPASTKMRTQNFVTILTVPFSLQSHFLLCVVFLLSLHLPLGKEPKRVPLSAHPSYFLGFYDNEKGRNLSQGPSTTLGGTEAESDLSGREGGRDGATSGLWWRKGIRKLERILASWGVVVVFELQNLEGRAYVRKGAFFKGYKFMNVTKDKKVTLSLTY